MSMFSISESNKSLILLVLEVAIFAGGLGVVALRKIVYSALLLGFVFICVSLLYLILNADFLAATQVLIYVGAVNVLILFGIMLINKPETKTIKQWTLGNTISLVISILFFLILIINIYSVSWENLLVVNSETSISETNVNIIGNHILTDMLLPFELLSVLLLVALVGAITIAKKDYLLENNSSSEIKKTTR